MDRRPLLPVGTVLQGRYRILRWLRAGGMGAVYEAVDDVINLSFAVKQTFADDDETQKAFKREAQILANVEHEALPRVFNYFTENDDCYFVMDFVQGEDLSELLKKRKAPFEQDQVLDWADQILDALEDLHEQKIFHRDIKPSNLKLTPKEKIKLLDFGIAKGALQGDTTVVGTGKTFRAATLPYSPLEQVLKASPDWNELLSGAYPEETLEYLQQVTNQKSDLYSLGATLYQLLTNHAPVNSARRALALWAGQDDKLRPAHELNSKISPEVSAVLQKAMELDQANRPGSAHEMREALRKAKAEIRAKEKAEKEILQLIELINRYPEIAKGIFKGDSLPKSDELQPIEQDAIGIASRRKLVVWAGVGAVAILGTTIGAISLRQIPQSTVADQENKSQVNQTANVQSNTEENLNINNGANLNASPLIIESPTPTPININRGRRLNSTLKNNQNSLTQAPVAEPSKPQIQTTDPAPEPSVTPTPIQSPSPKTAKPTPTPS